METIKFGLLLTIIPFFVIFQAITVWWALVDLTVSKIKGTERTMWTLLVILLPPVGAFLYNFMARQQSSAVKYNSTSFAEQS